MCHNRTNKVRKYLNNKGNTIYQNVWDIAQAAPTETFIPLKTDITRKKRSSQFNKLCVYLIMLVKKSNLNPKEQE